MLTPLYHPAMWLVIATLVIGLLGVTNTITYYRRRVAMEPQLREQCRKQLRFLLRVRWLLWVFAGVFTIGGAIAQYGADSASSESVSELRAGLLPTYEPDKIWEGPNTYLAETDDNAKLIQYGRNLIAHTQDYFGENGIVRPRSINGLDCQNCHLDAGSKPFGNNYFAVSSTYPQKRARSGSLETIPKRVNDCFQRSLNGEPLDSNSREMKAIIAYMQWLGTAVPKGEKPKGSGLVEVPFLDRPADPVHGEQVYATKCASCHGLNGQGLPIPNSAREYPPLWGERSYNEAAGLFRLSRFAGYVKANMPFGASFQNPQLTDEEAWDVAAFVNAQPRPKHPFLDTDWPKIEKKPYDHPFGPYADTFSEQQHKYGPFGPIVAYYRAQ